MVEGYSYSDILAPRSVRESVRDTETVRESRRQVCTKLDQEPMNANRRTGEADVEGEGIEHLRKADGIE